MFVSNKKKIAVVGRGTAGCLSFLHWHHFNGIELDAEIEWIYDSNIPSVPVGEGTDLNIPVQLGIKANFNTHDLLSIGGTPKLGIQKEDWNGSGSYLNPFPVGQQGIHMDAGELQKWVFNKFGRHVKCIDQNVKSVDDVDADHVMMAVGTPPELSESDFYVSNFIPVNSAYVTQCDWPNGFPHFLSTLAIARPWGWVFGIPLQKRCSIGYIFNGDITEIETIKEDVKHVFERYNVIPTEKTNTIRFNNYYRKNPISERVSYNGNSCFFLEPLEATSLSSAYVVDTLSWHRWFGQRDDYTVNDMFRKKMKQIETIICAHYWAGSIYKNEFWDMAQEKGRKKLEETCQNETYKEWLKLAASSPDKISKDQEFGTWDKGIWNINIGQLGLNEKITAL